MESSNGRMSLMFTGGPATGKTTLTNMFVEVGYEKIPGDTTRQRRDGELQGYDFNFIDKDEFFHKRSENMYIDENLKVTEYNGENYGSPNLWIEDNPHSIINPTSSITAEKVKQLTQNTLWIHLNATDQARYDRLQKRGASNEKISKRIKTGDSLGHNTKADINIDTSKIGSLQTFKEIIEVVSALQSGELLQKQHLDFSKRLIETIEVLPKNHIVGNSIDSLVSQGIALIQEYGILFNAKAGSGLQCHNVQFSLLNPKNRVHTLRLPNTLNYLCNEMLVYLTGNLNVDSGLGKAAKMRYKLADKDGNINSNYGYYVFHQKLLNYNNKTQLDWVIDCLMHNPDSRKAFININQTHHKSDTKDFPCTIGMQFYIKSGILYCDVTSRSTDIVTGLPYDMGFFSFVHELLFEILKEKGMKNIELGSTTMRAQFSQIYSHTQKKATEMSKMQSDQKIIMPQLVDGVKLFQDIKDGNGYTSNVFLQWLKNHSTL